MLIRCIACLLLACLAPWAGAAGEPASLRFPAAGIVALDGDWEFAPHRLLAPADPWPADAVQVPVPGAWNKVMGGGRGSGTYRLRVACAAEGPLALVLPFQHSAAAVFANGRLLASQGMPSADPALHRPAADIRVVDVPAADCPLVLQLQVANHEMARGGLLRSLRLGPREQVLQERDAALMRSQLALGALLVLGFFCLLFYAWRRQDRAPLFFGIFLMSCVVGLGLSGQRPLQPLLAGLGFEAYWRILFVNWFLGLGVVPPVLQALYPAVAGRIFPALAGGFAGGGVALALLVPVPVFALSAPLLLGLAAVVGLWVTGVLLLALRQRRPGALLLLLAQAMLLIAIGHDIVNYQRLLALALLPYGVLGFALAAALLLARRLAGALVAEERVADSTRRQAELAKRLAFIDTLFDAVPTGIALRDTEGRYLVVNGAWERYIGVGRESVIGVSLRDVPDAQARAMLKLDEEALALWPREAPACEVDYNGRRVQQTRTVVPDGEGGLMGVLVTSVDITDNHRMAQALATERDRLRLLVRATRAGFGDWDAVSDTVSYTARFKEMLGHPADADTSGWPSIFEMMHPDDRERARGEFRAMIRRRQPGEQAPGKPMSYRLRRAGGGWVWIHAEGVSQVDESGRTRRFITSYLDVTAFREQEEALRRSRDQVAAQAQLLEEQNERLQENVRLREEVERIGRHDLKTPLASIIAVPRLLREERRLGPEADELLGVVERAGYRILSMVNLSLDLYRMEQGTYVFRPDAVDLPDLAHKVMADMRAHAASKQVRLELQAWQPPRAWAEELLCYSLVANLLKNAVEASPEGGAVRIAVEAAEGGRVRLRIHNPGAVPEPVRGQFFHKYATAGKASGTGLGTYSAWLMAGVQDGSIAMETSEAGGTTLSVTLRAAPASAEPPVLRHAAERHLPEPAALAAVLQPARVLLVDDDEYNLLIVRRFLPTPPLAVETAINGRAALAAAERLWPDLVLMDLDMPVMGGLEAVSRLRALERAAPRQRCTVVALSSHDDETTRLRALGAGFDHYIPKPVTREAMHALLLRLQGAWQGDGGRPPKAASPPAAQAAGAGAELALDLDPDLVPMLPQFLASRRRLVDDALAAARRGERGELRRIAHQLAGSFALYGLRWAGDSSQWLERHAGEVAVDDVAAWAEGLSRHLDQVGTLP